MAQILIVDDHPVNRQFLAKLLGYVHHTVVEAADGVEALAAMRTVRPDLIITDIVMPRMDGVTFVKNVRRDHDFARIPIAFYTASHRVPDAEAMAKECGGVHVLHKPARAADILKTVNELLARSAPVAPGADRSIEVEDLRLAALTELGLDLTKETDPARLLDKFCQSLRYITGAGLAGILVLGPDHQGVRHFALSSPDEDKPPVVDPAATAKILTGLLGNEPSVRLLDPEIAPEQLGAWPEEPVHTFLAASIPLPGRPVGASWLYVIDKAGAAEFNREDERLAVTLATQVAVAYENARLHTVLRDRAVELEQEIAERNRAESERDRFFSQSLNLLFVAGFDGYFKRLNPAWETALGVSINELLAKPFLNAVHPDDRAAVTAEVEKLSAGGHTLSFECRSPCKDGSCRWLIWNVTPSLDRAEMYGTGYDITSRKQLEEQFRQAQKMEAVGRLAGGVAHDFNNLLTIITGYSDLILGSVHEGDPLKGLAEQIKRAGERAAGLTGQLLAFSRKQVLDPVTLSLNELMAETGRMLKRLIGEDIDLKIAAAPDLWLVKADKGQIEQVVMNLVINARDAMPRGGKLTIETRNVELNSAYVAAHSEAQAGRHVLLALSDTGCGMDPATRARIFEPFFTTKGEKGTGLGLATVFGIVKQSGGHIEVYSEPMVGTTFKIYLPEDRDPSRQAKSIAGVRMSPRGTETLLVAEDEDAVRDLTRVVLQKSGYTVLGARNGGEALLLSEKHRGPIHLLVTDVIMPNMSGPQLAQRLVAQRRDMRVLYLSGYTDDAIVHHGVLAPGTWFLQKPYSPDALVWKVREVLDAKPDA